MIIYVDDDVFIMHRNVDEHLEFLSKLFDKSENTICACTPKKQQFPQPRQFFWGFTLQAGG